LFRCRFPVEATVLILTLISIACPAWAMAPGGLEKSDFQFFTNPPPANDLKMGTSEGGILNLSDLKGRVVLLNFWRKDCQYCDLEKGQLKSMLQHVNPADVTVLCVNLWDSPAWVRQYAKKNGHNLNVLSKVEGRQAIVENVVGGRPLGYYVVNDNREAVYEVRGFPSTYVINKEGRVLASHLGLARWNSPPIRNWILELARAGTAGPRNESKTNGEVELPAWMDRLLSNATAGPRKLSDDPR